MDNLNLLTLRQEACDVCAGTDTVRVFSGLAPFGKPYRVVRCTGCGFVFNDVTTQEELRDHYRKYNMFTSSQLVQDWRSSDLFEHAVMQRDFILRHVALDNPKNVLDVGSGEGLFLEAFSDAGWVVSGVEPSDTLRAISMRRYPHTLVHGKMLEDITEYKPQHIVAVRHVLEHVLNPSGFLSLLRRHCADDGFLFVEVPDIAHPIVQMASVFSFEHVNHFCRETLEAAVENGGFVPIEIEEFDSNPSGSVPYPVLRCVAQPGAVVRRSDRRVGAERVALAVENYEIARAKLVSTVRERIVDACGDSDFAVFGAGTHSRELFDAMPDLLPQVRCFVDNDVGKQGGEYMGKRVISPEDLHTEKVDHVVLALLHSSDAERQLDEIEVSRRVKAVALYSSGLSGAV